MSRREQRQYRDFSLGEDHFVWRGESIPFDKVTHLFLSRVLTTQRVNWVKVGEARSAWMLITLNNGREIRLGFDEAGFFFGVNTEKRADIENLMEAYRYIAAKTFERRLAAYLQQVKECGYFAVDDCRLFPGKKVVWRDIEFPLSSSVFSRGPDYVFMRKKQFSILDKLWHYIRWSVPQFSTNKDGDVIMHLLDKLMGLRWKT